MNAPRPVRGKRLVKTRWLLRSVLALSLAGSGLLVSLGATAAHADSTDLLGYTAQADANTIDILVDTAAGLAGFHPISEADIPENSSDYETGPSGRSFASFAWPGAAAGNLGSLAGAFGAPDQLAPVVNNLNYPVRASASYPGGSGDAVYPPSGPGGVATMHAHSDATQTYATAAFSDLTSALFSVQGLQGATKGTATKTSAVATASGSFSGFSLLGGLVTVGATSSEANATSDGKAPGAKSTTHIGALTVLGHQASVGSDGLVIGPATASGLGALTAPTEQQVNAIIGLLNLKVVTLPEVKKTDVPAGAVTSGALQISFTLPSQVNLNVDCSALKALPEQLQQLAIICTFPGLLTGASVTFTLGRVTAQAVATPPFDLSGLSGPPPVSTPALPTQPVSTGAATVPAVTGNAALPGANLGPGTVTPGTPPETAPQVAAPPQALGPSQDVALSKPVGGGLLFFLLLLGGLAGGLLLWMSTLLDAVPGAACPLEDAVTS
jgi:hypothetical protein